MHKLWIDFETYSETNLKLAGAYAYAKDPSMTPLLFSYALDDEPVRVLDLEAEPQFPQDVRILIEDPDVLLYARNANFEAHIFDNAWKKFGLTEAPPIPKYMDTASISAYFGWPRQLEACAEALETPIRKNPLGKQLIRKFCVPNRWGYRNPMHASPIERGAFINYCADDVNTDRACIRLMPDDALLHSEHVLWALTRFINQQGIPVDLDLAKRLSVLIDREKDALNAELHALTDGAVGKATERDKLMRWLRSVKVTLPDLKKPTLENMDLSLIPPAARRAIAIRQIVASSSTAKFKRMLLSAVNGRVYESLIHYGAHTGRFSGYGIQWHNLPRASFDDPYPVIRDILLGKTYGYIRSTYGPLHKTGVKLIRSAIRPTPPNMVAAADLSSIENILLHWAAGDIATTEDFRDGVDQYKRFASRRYRIEYDAVTNKQRKESKPAVLGLGFGGGPNALMRVARNYGVALDEDRAIAEVRFYRRLYREVVVFWAQCYRAAIEAVLLDERRPVKLPDGNSLIFSVLKTSVTYLVIDLPSGRSLYYPHVKYDRRDGLSYKGEAYGSFMRTALTPGGIVENIIQALARDILATGKLRAVRAGLKVILSVHDEVVIETDDKDDLQKLIACMTAQPYWARNIPIKAVGYVAPRYKKD
jgi:DNA polymerase